MRRTNIFLIKGVEKRKPKPTAQRESETNHHDLKISIFDKRNEINHFMSARNQWSPLIHCKVIFSINA